MSSMWMLFGIWVVMGLGGGIVLGRSIVLADRRADGHAPAEAFRRSSGSGPAPLTLVEARTAAWR